MVNINALIIGITEGNDLYSKSNYHGGRNLSPFNSPSPTCFFALSSFPPSKAFYNNVQMQKTEGDTAPAMIDPTIVLVKWTYQSNRNPTCAAAGGAQAQWPLVHLLCVAIAFVVCLKHLLAALLHHHLPSPPCSTITSCNHGLTMVSSRVHWQGSVDLWTKKEWWVHFSNHCLTMVSSRVVW